jgi:hypothetical protein
MRDQRSSIGLKATLIAIFATTVLAANAQAAREKVVHAF